jgi:hypothetical protein
MFQGLHSTANALESNGNDATDGQVGLHSVMMATVCPDEFHLCPQNKSFKPKEVTVRLG